MGRCGAHDEPIIEGICESCVSEFKCVCDCGCSKNNDRADDQCDDCDNGIHWDEIKKVYVRYDDELTDNEVKA